MGTSMVMLTIVACSTVALAQPTLSATQLASKLPDVRVTALDLSGRSLSGQLVTADLASVVQLVVDGKPVIVSGADLVWLGIDVRPGSDIRPVAWFPAEPLPGKPAPTLQPQVEVILREGQIILAGLGDDAADTLSLDHRLLGRLGLPFSQIRQLRLRAGGINPANASAPATQPTGMLDVLLLTNGDRIEGIVRQIGPEQIVLESADGDRKLLPADSVQVVAFADAGAPGTVPASGVAVQTQGAGTVEAWLHLRTGETILVRSVAYSPSEGLIHFRHQERPLSIKPAELAGIEPVSPRWQWLTKLSPSRYEHRPLLSPTLPWRVDATCTGEPIRADGQPVLRGIGVPAGSTLQYDLAGRWRKLLVWPMLDDSANGVGHCSAAVRVDGKDVWQGTIRGAGTQPGVVIDVSNRRDLTLEVGPAESGDILDRFVWGWAVVAK
mgnify:CR=1 FL=1